MNIVHENKFVHHSEQENDLTVGNICQFTTLTTLGTKTKVIETHLILTSPFLLDTKIEKVANDCEAMKVACDLASHSVTIGGGPFGCVITDHEYNVVGKGHNMVTINNDPTQHAEVVAIRDACKQLNTFNLQGLRLYTSCEPCPMCLAAIYWSRIDTVFYGNTRKDAKDIGFDDDLIYDEINKSLDERIIPMKSCSHDYALKSFQQWSDKSDKTPY